ncbi:MAG: hypothetical protein KAH20_06695 [Methylococcales bacterium]|nr:hypothetical protein [Methylococcales bacterium]
MVCCFLIIILCFGINHNKAGFADFFEKIEPYRVQSNGVVSVAGILAG